MDYKNLDDDQLILKLHNGDESVQEYILEKYKELVKNEAKKLYLLGGDNDDLIQEGMIGLLKAIRTYKPESKSSFYSFARMCIDGQMYSAIKASNRKKHMPLNSYVSIHDSDESGDIQGTKELLSDKATNPETLYLHREYSESFSKEIVSRLSEMEKEVLLKHISGLHYKEIAEIMAKEPKAIDNTLQRAKIKAKKILKKLTT